MSEIAKDQSFPRDPDRTDVGVIGGTWTNTVSGVIWDYVGQYVIEADKLMSVGYVWERRVSSVSEQVQTNYTQNDSTAKDYIKNRPGGYEEGFEITWDGDTTGRVSATAEGMPGAWYKVSDKILTADDIIGSTITRIQNGVSQSLVITSDMSDMIFRSDYGVAIGEPALMISAKQGIFNMGYYNISIPEPGIYFLSASVGGNSALISSLSNIIVHPFDGKYIPDTIPRKDEVYTKDEVYNKGQVYSKNETYPKGQLYTKDNLYTKSETYAKSEVYPKTQVYSKDEVNEQLGKKADISLSIAGVEVGNIARVDSVDENGNPTKWGVVNANHGMIIPSEDKVWMIRIDHTGNVSGIDITSNYTDATETITDSWEEIVAACANGTYSTKYNVGDTKLLNLGSEGIVAMQIAAFGADDLADGSGKAPISWISEQLLKTNHRMNPEVVINSDKTYQEGTGSIGGWEKSEMRSYLIDTIKPLIPTNVSNAIKLVTKTQPAYNTSGSYVAQTTTDDVWIPSDSEIFGSSSSLYYPLFQDTSANRIKKKLDSTSASSWWIRSVNDVNGFGGVNSDGNVVGYYSNRSYSIALGFCT